MSRIAFRIGLLMIVLLLIGAMWWLINKGFHKITLYIERNKNKWLKNLNYKDYTFLTADQEYKSIIFLLTPLRWSIYAIILYIAIPITFSIYSKLGRWFIRPYMDPIQRYIYSIMKLSSKSNYNFCYLFNNEICNKICKVNIQWNRSKEIKNIWISLRLGNTYIQYHKNSSLCLYVCINISIFTRLGFWYFQRSICIFRDTFFAWLFNSNS